MEDAELHAILSKEDVHRNRDAERYAFMQENIEEYAQTMTRRYMTCEVLYEDIYCKVTDNPYITEDKLQLEANSVYVEDV